MIALEILKRKLSLSKEQQGLATGANTREALRPIFLDAIANQWTSVTRTPLSLNEVTLQRMIVKYSEQWVFQPLREIQRWFAYEAGAYLDPGYPPLYYTKAGGGRPSPNKSAVAAIGEGVAGFLAQRLYRCRKLARPNHDYPDAIMEANNHTFLLEAKATTQMEESEQIAKDELPRLISFASSANQMDVRQVTAIMVATELISETEYRCQLVEVDLQ
jgi:hypothetical protein